MAETYEARVHVAVDAEDKNVDSLITALSNLEDAVQRLDKVKFTGLESSINGMSKDIANIIGQFKDIEKAAEKSGKSLDKALSGSIKNSKKNSQTDILSQMSRMAKNSKDESNKMADLAKNIDTIAAALGGLENADNLTNLFSSIGGLKKNATTNVQTLATALTQLKESLSGVPDSGNDFIRNFAEVASSVNQMEKVGRSSSSSIKAMTEEQKNYLNVIKELRKTEKEYQTLSARETMGTATASDITRKEHLARQRDPLIEQKKAYSGEYTDALKNADAAFESYSKRLENTAKANIEFAKTNSTVKDSYSKMNEALGKLSGGDETEKFIKDTQEAFKKLRNEFAETGDIDKFTSKFEKLYSTFSNKSGFIKAGDQENAIATLKKNLIDASGDKLGEEDIKINIKTNGVIEASGQFKEVNGELVTLTQTVNTVDGAVSTMSGKLSSAGSVMKNSFSALKNTFGEIAKYALQFASVGQVMQYLKQGAEVVTDFDTALTEMRKVANDVSKETLVDFQKESFSLGDTVGTTALQIQNSTSEFMRLGETFEESKKSAVTANKLMAVSEFDDIKEATTALIAMKAAYDDVSKESIVDKLNEVGNNYSISTDGIAKSLQRSASALTTAGVDIDHAIGLVTAGNKVVQNPEQVGNAIRTIVLRMTGTSKAALQEMGEETDGVADTVSKLRQTIMDTTKVASNGFKGVDILDANGNYRVQEALQEIVDIYDEIEEADKKYGRNNKNLLLETIAGKTRSNVAASIFQSGSTYADATESARTANGSSQKELDVYLESTEAKIQHLTNDLQQLAVTAINSDSYKGFLDFLDSAVQGLTQIVDKAGTVKTVLGALFTKSLAQGAIKSFG